MAEENKSEVQEELELKQALAVLRKYGVDLSKGITEEQKAKSPKRFNERETPEGWSSTSVAVYYNEREALAVKKMFDELMSKDVAYFVLPIERLTRKMSTVYTAIIQGSLYLRKKLDPSGIYENFYQTIQIERDPRGIIIQKRKFKVDETKPVFDHSIGVVQSVADEIEEHRDKSTWRTKVDDFLTNAQDGDKLEIRELLSQDDRADLEISLTGLQGIVWSITPKRVMIRKYSGDLPPMIQQ